MILVTPVFDEIKSIVATTLNLTSDQLVTVSVKFIRFDWRQLIEYFQNGFSARGINPPWIIIRQMPEQEEEWGMANTTFSVPFEVFFLEDEKHYVDTTTTNLIPVTTSSLDVANASYFFVGQRIWLSGNNVFTTVTSIVGLTIGIADHLIISANTHVLSEVNTDVYTKIELLRDAFDRKTYTNFQIVEQPQCDVSDMNPVNAAHETDDYFLFAGSCFFKALVGSIP